MQRPQTCSVPLPKRLNTSRIEANHLQPCAAMFHPRGDLLAACRRRRNDCHGAHRQWRRKDPNTRGCSHVPQCVIQEVTFWQHAKAIQMTAGWRPGRAILAAETVSNKTHANVVERPGSTSTTCSHVPQCHSRGDVLAACSHRTADTWLDVNRSQPCAWMPFYRGTFAEDSHAPHRPQQSLLKGVCRTLEDDCCQYHETWSLCLVGLVLLQPWCWRCSAWAVWAPLARQRGQRMYSDYIIPECFGQNWRLWNLWKKPWHPKAASFEHPLDFEFWRRGQSKSPLGFCCDMCELTKLTICGITVLLEIAFGKILQVSKFWGSNRKEGPSCGMGEWNQAVWSGPSMAIPSFLGWARRVINPPVNRLNPCRTGEWIYQAIKPISKVFKI